jgi:hypothetical protein
MDCQDWESVKLKPTAKKAVSKPARSAGATALSHVEAEELPLPTKSLGPASRAEIIRLRTTHVPAWTQADLNRACSFSPHTIRDIEAGRLCPTPKQLDVLNRVLHAALKYA